MPQAEKECFDDYIILDDNRQDICPVYACNGDLLDLIDSINERFDYNCSFTTANRRPGQDKRASESIDYGLQINDVNFGVIRGYRPDLDTMMEQFKQRIPSLNYESWECGLG